MTTVESVGFLLACTAGYVLARDIIRAPRLHRLRDRIKREKNRNRFGELRTRIVHQAVTGGLNPRSQLFASIYGATTSLMRDPYALDVAAQTLLLIPPPERQRTSGPRPTKLEGEFARDFAERINLLCRDYSKVYAVGAWITDRLRDPAHVPPLWLLMVAKREEQRRVKVMIKAQKRLEDTAQLATC